MCIEVKFVNKIDEKLRQLKSQRGITKAEVAEKMGITKQALDTLIHTKNPGVVTLIRLAYVIGCSVCDLFSYEIQKDCQK